MKKNTVKMFVAGFMLAAFAANAQTAEQKKTITKDYDKEAMRKMANDFNKEWDANYAEAKRLAEINGWPLHFTEGNNSVRLAGVKEDGSPLYFTTLNANAAFSSGINSFYNNGGLGINLTGTGMEVGVWDEERPNILHATFNGRFEPIDSATEMTTHPTHVGGTVLGSGIGSSNLSARGMAYTAHGYSLDWNNDITEMTSMAETAGLLVSNHSYGAHPASVSTWEWGAYNNRSRQYDQVAFAAKNYLIVKAAGNDRGDFNIVKGGYDLINGAATSKNVLTVAAVQGLNSVYNNPSQVVMSSFSSWGPTDDKRIKPDISAKGVNVFSSVLNGSSNTTYGNLSGTSMASPVVTGGALLLQQLYLSQQTNVPDENRVPMRSATLRGLICHTADEAGPDDGPDAMFGWGLFDAKKAGQAILDRGTKSIIEENSKAGNSQNYTFNVNVAEPGKPLQVSITWTDPAGNVTSGTVDSAARKLVNDLDVRVSQGEVVYFPWRLTANNGEAAERGDNIVDNVERIDIPSASGQYTVTVSHKGNMVQGPQQYSLIVTNASKVLSTDKNEVNLFSIWPNPANTEINIGLVDLADADVAFYDVQGREVLSSALTQMQTTISTTQLSAGVYMVKVSQAGKQQLKKVIINK